MNRLPDFIAELQYKTSAEGGRKTPAFSGYRPQVKFGFNEMQTSGQQKFIDKDTVFPGDRVRAEITLITTSHLKNSLNIGYDFDFKKGSRIIGTGKIVEIVNVDLISQ
jgi:translation elongation factor EF-Tu-like GTPase